MEFHSSVGHPTPLNNLKLRGDQQHCGVVRVSTLGVLRLCVECLQLGTRVLYRFVTVT